VNAPAVIFGVPIDDLTMATTIDRIAELVIDGRRHGRSHQVATVNVDFLVNALAEPELMRLLQDTSLNLPDGMPILWASSLLGTPLTERVAGSDLVPKLARESEMRDWRIHLFGGAPCVADRARLVLSERYAGAMITADEGPVLHDVSEIDESVIDRIHEIDPDILCVALGNPKQERFIAAYGDRLRCPVMIGIGGSLDLLIGDKRRAPLWAQRGGIEWAYRALQEPRRLGGRYLHDARVFGPSLTRYARAVRRHRSGSELGVEIHGDVAVVQIDPDGLHSPSQWQAASKIDLAAVHIDYQGVSAISPLSHAALLGLVRHAVQRDVSSTATGWTPPLRQCIADFGTLSWFEAVTPPPSSEASRRCLVQDRVNTCRRDIL